MDFEWDSVKNKRNVEKHSISFEQAIEIWNLPHVDIENLAYSTNGETRSATLGQMGKKVYVIIWTMRNSKIRIVSARRANKNEEKIFFEKIQNEQGNG